VYSPDQTASSADFNSTEKEEHVNDKIPHTSWSRGELDVATHIDSAFLISSFFILSRYLAIRMPAGHNMPPHPAARSSCKRSGGSKSPPKSMDLMLAGMCSGDLTKSSPKARNSCSGDGEREAIEVDMVSMLFHY
jgi:hypothetical protein